MPPTVKPWSLALPALLLLLSGGCGLSEYEGRMREAEVRVKRFDEENQFLDDPLDVPTRKDKTVDVPVGELFFRPPKGVAKIPDKNAQATEILCHYRGGSPYCSDLYLVFGDGKNTKDQVEKQIEDRLGAAAQAWQSKEVRSPGRDAPLHFDFAEFFDPHAQPAAPATYVVDVNTDGQPVVAVVFRIEQANRTPATHVLDLSLQSFAAGHEAAKKARDEYDKRQHPFPGSGP